MEYSFRQATMADSPAIWEILEAAIQRRKADGSAQWQDGYPNPEIVKKDLEQGQGYVLTAGGRLVAYAALLMNDEPAYAHLDGNWLSNGDFLVIHRVAVAQDFLHKGLGRRMLAHIETFAVHNKIYSIKADTNFDNPGMISLFEKQGYVYCGEVFFRGSSRRAYEKLLVSG